MFHTAPTPLKHVASSLNFLSWTSFSAVLTSTFSSIHASSINLSHSFISLHISDSASITFNLEKTPLLRVYLSVWWKWNSTFLILSNGIISCALLAGHNSFYFPNYSFLIPCSLPQQQEWVRYNRGAGYSSFCSAWSGVYLTYKEVFK